MFRDSSVLNQPANGRTGEYLKHYFKLSLGGAERSRNAPGDSTTTMKNCSRGETTHENQPRVIRERKWLRRGARRGVKRHISKYHQI